MEVVKKREDFPLFLFAPSENSPKDIFFAQKFANIKFLTIFPSSFIFLDPLSHG